ncbi:hypothetical protein HDV05_006671 [Chytridiales sp. JEL 0842]|nr:hypothetical protein HDV05_006671 [Chytridiales sp. JEL 0842]
MLSSESTDPNEQPRAVAGAAATAAEVKHISSKLLLVSKPGPEDDDDDVEMEIDDDDVLNDQSKLDEDVVVAEGLDGEADQSHHLDGSEQQVFEDGEEGGEHGDEPFNDGEADDNDSTWRISVASVREDSVFLDKSYERDFKNRRRAVDMKFVQKEPVAPKLGSLRWREESRPGSPAAPSVFKVETVACIASKGGEQEIDDEDHDAEATNFSSVSSSNGFCVAVDNLLYLLSEDCSAHLATITLDCASDSIAFNRNSTFLVVGDALGAIHFIHINSSSILFSHQLPKALLQAENNFSSFKWMGFVGSTSDTGEELIIVLASMTLVRFSQVDFGRIEEAIEQKNVADLLAIKGSISLEIINLVESTKGIVKQCFDVVPWYDDYDMGQNRLLLAGEGAEPITIWKRVGDDMKTTKVDGVAALLEGVSVLKAQCDRTGKYLILLDSEGRLTIWDFKRLVILHEYIFTSIADFNIMPFKEPIDDSSAATILNIVILSKAEKEERFIEIISLPSYSVIYRVNVAADCFLPKANHFMKTTSQDSNPSMHFIEGLRQKGAKRISKYYVRSLSETMPLQKFASLLERKHFEEAEILCRQFGLDNQVLLKAKLDHMLLEGLKNDEETTEDVGTIVDQVLNDLRQIHDESFILNFCLSASLPSFAATYRLLSFAKTLVSDSTSKSDPIAKEQAEMVHGALRRLGTFQLLVTHDQSHLLAEVGPKFDGALWQAFRDCDLVAAICNRVRKGDMKLAILLWRRHYLDEGLVQNAVDIIKEIPDDVKPDEIIPWLYHEVIPNVQKVDDRIELAEWIEQRARSVEALERRPHNALALISLFDAQAASDGSRLQKDVQAFSPATPSSYVRNMVSASQFNSNPSVEPRVLTAKQSASTLKSQLEDLVYLWDVHNFKITLSEYCQSTPNSIALDLLARVASLELLSDAVEKHFRPYVERHQLVDDNLFVEYCAELMDGAVGVSTALSDAPWETRVLAIVEHIQDQEQCARVILEVMRRTPVPWSTAVEKVIYEALSWKNLQQLDDLREQYRLMRMKRMILNYGLTDFNIAATQEAKSLLRFILAKTENTNAVRDAMQVISAYNHLSKMDAFIMRVQYLLEEGHVERALLLLRTGSELDGNLPQNALLDEELGLDMDAKLEPVEMLAVCEYICVWLFEVIEDAVREEQRQDGDKSESCFRFNWAIGAAIDLSQFLFKVREDFIDDLHSGSSAPSLIPSKNSTVATWISSTISNLPMSSNSTLLAAAIPCCSKETIQALKYIRDLSKEFDIRLDVQTYMQDETTRRGVLRHFAKGVFKYGGSATQSAKGKETKATSSDVKRTELYRLAEILGFERSNLTGTIAEEAARNGDFKTALLLCKELYEKFPNETSAVTLKRIALLITSYSSENKNVFRDVKEAKCDSGDYDNLVGQEEKLADEASNSYSSFYSQSLSQGSSSSSSSSFTSSHSSSSSAFNAFDRVHDIEVANIDDRYACSLFEDDYHEAGLILPTEKTMSQVTSYVLDMASSTPQHRSDDYTLGDKHDIVPYPAHLLSPNSSMTMPQAVSAKSAGKRKQELTCDPVRLGRDLAEYLQNNRVLMMGLRVWHRTIEMRVRKCGGAGNLYGVGAGGEGIGSGDGDEMDIEKDTDGHVRIVKQLAQSVLSSRHIDQNLAFGSLLTLPLEESYEAFKAGMSTTASDYDRLLKFAAVGVAFAVAYGQRTFLTDCQELAANARWWHQFRLLDIKCDIDQYRASKHDAAYHRRLIPHLLSKTNLDVVTALEFARSYHIDDDYVLLEYVTQLLHSLEDSGSYKARVAGVVEDVSNQGRLLETLMQVVIPRVSPYDYERLLFIFSQILRIDESNEDAKRGTMVLEVLGTYTRVKAPAMEELLEAKRAVLNQTVIPEKETLGGLMEMFPQSRKCLPFHLLIQDPWATLTNELSDQTLIRLISLSVPMGLSTDEFYTNVITGLVDRVKQSQTTESPSATTLPRFLDFKPLLSKIKDPQTALKAAVFVGEAFAYGMDRIQAYKVAVQFAERFGAAVLKDLESKDPASDEVVGRRAHVDKTIQRIKDTLVLAETEHQLRSLGLESFLEYMDAPQELIGQMYYRLSEKALSENATYDLHRVCNEIGARHGVDVGKLRTILVQKFIGTDIPSTPEEKQLYLPSMRVQINTILDSRGEKSIQLRLLYLFRSVTMNQAVKLLLSFAYQPTSKVTTLHRVRALSVLFQLATPDAIQLGIGEGMEQVMVYMQMLLYLADFEELRIVQSIKDFEKCDKEALARSLWVNHSNEPKVLQLICNICLDYGIGDLQLWENALGRLVRFGALRYLLGILEHLTSIPELGQMKSLPAIWNTVLLESLQSILVPSAPSDMDKDKIKEDVNSGGAMMERVLGLIQKCPFVLELKVESFIEVFKRVIASEKLTSKQESAVPHKKPDLSTPKPEVSRKLTWCLKGLASLPYGPLVLKALRECVAAELQTSTEVVEVLRELVPRTNFNMHKMPASFASQPSKEDVGAKPTEFELCIGSKVLVNCLFERLDAMRGYVALGGAPSTTSTTANNGNDMHILSLMVRYLISVDRIEGLLDAVVSMGKWEEAASVVRLYCLDKGLEMPESEDLEVGEDGGEDEGLVQWFMQNCLTF